MTVTTSAEHKNCFCCRFPASESLARLSHSFLTSKFLYLLSQVSEGERKSLGNLYWLDIIFRLMATFFCSLKFCYDGNIRRPRRAESEEKFYVSFSIPKTTTFSIKTFLFFGCSPLTPLVEPFFHSWTPFRL
jgi:hypothetical protein